MSQQQDPLPQNVDLESPLEVLSLVDNSTTSTPEDDDDDEISTLSIADFNNHSGFNAFNNFRQTYSGVKALEEFRQIYPALRARARKLRYERWAGEAQKAQSRREIDELVRSIVGGGARSGFNHLDVLE